jgi:nucleotide-binding universal stress UspA family protein
VDEAPLGEVVVGVDGSAGARTALAWGLREARLRGAAVRLVTVWPEDRPPHLDDAGPGRPGPADVEQDVRTRMAAEAAEIAAATGCESVPVHPEVRSGHPAQQLVDTAGAEGLLVVGSRGRGSLRGVLLGSVGQQCAQHGRGPVVVVRGQEPAGDLPRSSDAGGRVVVGVDGSAGSAAALRFAAEEARRRGGELHVVHAFVDTVSGYGGPPWAVPVTTLREQADATLRESLQEMEPPGSPGVRVRAETVEGVDWDVLTRVAAGADLLVVGSRGRSGWSALLLGSVGLHAVTDAPCPVAVVRPARG